jgi:hypothetical protein
MNPFSLELTAAHRKFEFDRAVKRAQIEGNIRREAEAARQRMVAAEQSTSSGNQGLSYSLLALLRRLIPARLNRTTVETHL